jgi:multidrug transporter EmrE-like cation transporter
MNDRNPDATRAPPQSGMVEDSASRAPARWLEQRMNSAALGILVSIGIVIVTVGGDYLLKLASEGARPFASWWFVGGVIVYAMTAFGWVFVMRRLNFATMGVVYAAATVLLLTLVGVVVLHETLRWQEVVGIALALVSIGLLARFA